MNVSDFIYCTNYYYHTLLISTVLSYCTNNYYYYYHTIPYLKVKFQKKDKIEPQNLYDMEVIIVVIK